MEDTTEEERVRLPETHHEVHIDIEGPRSSFRSSTRFFSDDSISELIQNIRDGVCQIRVSKVAVYDGVNMMNVLSEATFKQREDLLRIRALKAEVERLENELYVTSNTYKLPD